MGIEQLYLIHHSHTDIGYTHDQPVVWELERRFLDAALDLCEQGEDGADDAFRWTIETTEPLLRWLAQADAGQIERLRRAERAGRLEAMGMPLNLTPLVDTDQLIESLQPLSELRERFGLTIAHAMNCDVNGHNWPLVDTLLDAGIEAFSMAINETFGGAPLQRPNVFRWEGPSGRSLLTLNGWHYMHGNFLGIPQDVERFRTRWAETQRQLEAQGWPFTVVPVQITHPSGDNGSADPRLPEFVRAWNAAGNAPRIRIALPRDWWRAVRASGVDIPTYRGDWTDYWNFGAISSARETTINRRSRVRLRNADALAAVDPAGSADREGLRRRAWRALTLWDEHTWGASLSVRDPEHDDVAAQWHHKAIQAYEARSLSLLLQRDAMAELVRRIPRDGDDALVVFNPSPFTRHIGGPVPQGVLSLHGLPGDASATRHWVDREMGAPTRWLPAVEVPGLGWRVIPSADLRELRPGPQTSAATIENRHFRVTFDRTRGGICGWWDKTRGLELVDTTAPWPLAAFAHEEVADHDHDWPRHLLYRHPDGWSGDWHARRSGAHVRRHQVFRSADAWQVVQRLDAPGVDEATLTFTLPDAGGSLEVRASWRMRPTTHPEATYLVFPFALTDPIVRFDAGGVAVRLEDDQIPGCCRDYFTTQHWVDLTGGRGGVTVATPDNPLAQVGGFQFGRAARTVDLARAWFLGWVTNNYWETNFRAHQVGRVQARYCLRPHGSPFDEEAAHRFGEETAQEPVWGPCWDPAGPDADLPRVGRILEVEGRAVRVLHLWPGAQGQGLLRLANASEQSTVARIAGGARPLAAAARCDLFARQSGALEVRDGACSVDIGPRGVATLRLDWAGRG